MKKLILGVLALCSYLSARGFVPTLLQREEQLPMALFSFTYSADDYGMFASLCHYPAGKHPKGAKREIVDYDSGERHGFIDEAPETYNVIGNINEYQVSIGETTYGGRKEMVDNTGIIDYGSLMYLGLQRSKTAREAIKVMTDLVEKYGYQSSGESFTIASYMIGIALGHDKTYACFYESLPLAIYKSKEEMAAILLRKQEERKRAKLEMERIEREREREREFEAKRRKGVKKKGKKDREYSPFAQSGYSLGRGGYPTWGRQSEESFPPCQEDDPDYIPSTMDRGYEHETPRTKTNKCVSQVDTSNKTGNLFGNEEIQEIDIQTRKLISFPLTLQKYTKHGKPSKAKNSKVVVHNKEEYQNFFKSHPEKLWNTKNNEIWNILFNKKCYNANPS